MEEDADQVLRYMASNGLVANAKKTSFLLLNCNQVDYDIKVKIGSKLVPREASATLLGIKFQDDLQWKTQVYGKGGILSSLNCRLYIIRRMMSHLTMDSVCKQVDGLFTSKIRYGLQLIGKVRTKAEDPECAIFKDIQLVQNRLLRLLNRSQIKDKISNKAMLKKFSQSNEC